MKKVGIFLLVLCGITSFLQSQDEVIPTSAELKEEILNLDNNKTFLVEQREMPIGLRTILWLIEFTQSYGEETFFEPGFWSSIDQIFCRIPDIPRKLVMLSERVAPRLHRLLQSVSSETYVKKPIVLMIDDISYDYFIGTCSFGWGRSLLVFGKKALLELSTSDLRQYIAHEMGHLCLHHSAKRELSRAVTLLVGYAILSLGFSWYSRYPLLSSKTFLFMLLVLAGPKIVKGFQHYAIRKARRNHEFAADTYAVNLLKNPQAYQESLKKMYELSLEGNTKSREEVAQYAKIVLDRAHTECSTNAYEYIRGMITSELASLSDQHLSELESHYRLSMDERMNYLSHLIKH